MYRRGAVETRSQQSACGDYDRHERRDLLREIQLSLDSEANASLPNTDHNATRLTEGSNSVEPTASAEDWLIQARLRLAALRSAAESEAACSANDAEQTALREGQSAPSIEPARAQLSNQSSTALGSEQVAEMAVENRNLISVSLGGRIFRALINSRAMVSLVGAEIARLW